MLMRNWSCFETLKRPKMPNDSNDDGDVGLERSGSWSRGAAVIHVSPPYFSFIGLDERLWPLEFSGWIRRPSTAAQMMSLRAMGILRRHAKDTATCMEVKKLVTDCEK